MNQIELTEELDGSELGTKEFWDQRYKTEINNFKSHGDVGEIWFGDDAGERVINWIVNKSNISPESARIVDVGCGNGMFLIDMAERQFQNLTGVDYSAAGIDLAKAVAEKNNYSNIQYKVCNILDEDLTFDEAYDLIHDKGTYDAISLHPEDPKKKRLLYIQNMSKFLNNNGILVLTSCNWTKDELIQQFCEYFKLKQVIPTPQFKFGGKTGNIVTSICFEKKL